MRKLAALAATVQSFAPFVAHCDGNYTLVKTETVTTRTALLRDVGLERSPIGCGPGPGPSTRELFAYLECRHSPQPARANVIKIAEETSIPGAVDSVRRYELSLEFPKPLREGKWQLPSTEIKLFFSDCDHVWVSSTGCSYGSTADGAVELVKAASGGYTATVDIQLRPKGFRSPGLVVDGEPMRLLKRATVQSD